MKSLIIGISRPGDADGVPLIDDAKYVSRCGNFPEVTFSVGCKQTEFFKNVAELRYSDADPSASSTAIAFFQKLAGDVFKKLQYINIDTTDKTPLHIRLITTPMELAQLPFEFVPAPWSVSEGEHLEHLLTDDQRMITLTREVLQASETGYRWPVQPRILFAWAAPAEDVPHELHKKALMEAVYPLIKPKPGIPVPEPNSEPFFTELPNASLASIKKEIGNAIKAKKQYSHIHILAHGSHVVDWLGVSFRLLLCDESDTDSKKSYKAKGVELIDTIIQDKDAAPIILTLSACDSGNTGNVLAPSGSLVYQLHNAGIPCVFASQFPLTKEGSVELVRSLYADFIKGIDPREALYNARKELKKNKTHDWASLIAYAKFPDDINEQANAIWLRILFSSMKTTGEWVDHVLNHKDMIGKNDTLFDSINKRLENSINELSKLLTPDVKESKLSTDALRSEHLGLLGSAYKRKAEFLYTLARIYPEKEKDYIDRSIATLRSAKDFYEASYDTDINNHWAAMQYLSLKIVTAEFSEEDKALWDHIHFVTKQKEKKEKDILPNRNKLWAWGTLAELYLIKPMTTVKESLEIEIPASQKAAENYCRLIKEAGDDDLIDSTKRQLNRYISWWPEMLAEYPSQLKEMALEISKELLSTGSLVEKHLVN